jgi:acyl-CoA thioester hydrolase
MDFPVTYRRKVRFSDSDAQGIVFNGNYLRYFDDTITDFFDVVGLEWAELNRRGYDIVLGRVEIDFKASARIGETIVTGARVASVGTSSVVFELATWDESSRRIVAEGREIQVVVDPATFEKATVPAFFVDAVERVQGPVDWKGRP